MGLEDHVRFRIDRKNLRVPAWFRSTGHISAPILLATDESILPSQYIYKP